MDPITLEKQDNRLIISIEESYLRKDIITKLIDRLKWEHLIEKADFDESIVELGEQIKADWWAKNKDRFLRGTE
ncbi:hypothetical protein ACAW74_19450 [Fibrella sp. WM1]|uniref:hypothetical protein n=1 Tax=Fibrella musci TaxID=3242485 RepID=UPI0035201250